MSPRCTRSHPNKLLRGKSSRRILVAWAAGRLATRKAANLSTAQALSTGIPAAVDLRAADPLVAPLRPTGLPAAHLLRAADRPAVADRSAVARRLAVALSPVAAALAAVASAVAAALAAAASAVAAALAAAALVAAALVAPATTSRPRQELGRSRALRDPASVSARTDGYEN